MTAISCSSCSATPTPQSLLLEALSKGESLKKGGVAGNDKGAGAGKGSDASQGASMSSADSVRISAAGYQQLQQDAAGETLVNPVAPVDVYNKTGLQALPSSSQHTA